MDYRSFTARIEVNDGFNCPYCGAKIEQLNVLFMKYHPDGEKIAFGIPVCCEAADNSLFEIPADTAFSYETLPGVLDVMREKLDGRRECVKGHA